MSIHFLIPAIREMRLLRGKPTITTWVGGHLAAPYKMSKESRVRLTRWKTWRVHARHHIRLALRQAGYDTFGGGRWEPYDAKGWAVRTWAVLPNLVHPDAENIHKAVVDCLVHRVGKGSDGHGFFDSDKDLAGAFNAVAHGSEVILGKYGVYVVIYGPGDTKEWL